MDIFLLALNAVLPLLILMVLGIFLRGIHLFTEDLVKKINKLLFHIFFPIMVFNAVYSSDLKEIFNLRLFLFIALGILCYVALLWFLSFGVSKEKGLRGVFIQGSLRSNCIMFGLAIANTLYGSTGVGATAFVACILMVVFNIVSSMVFADGEKGFLSYILSVAKNPLLIAVFIGLVFALVDIPLPSIIDGVISDIAAMTSTWAIIVLGAGLALPALTKKHRKGDIDKPLRKHHYSVVLAAVVMKLVVEPLLFLPLAIWLDFQGAMFVAILSAVASPTSTVTYSIAAEMSDYSDEAGEIVAVSALLSVVTIFFIVFVSKYLGFF